MNKSIWIIIVLFLISNVLTTNLNKECCFSTNSYRYDNWVILTDFYQFDQLNFNCNQPIDMSNWELKPTSKTLILDDSLKINNLSIRIDDQSDFSIVLNNFYGFDLSANPFRYLNLINFEFKYIFWMFKNSNFDFFYKNTSLNGKCDFFMSTNREFFHESLFQKFKLLFLGDSVKFSGTTCPIIFNNTQITYFSIDKISNSFIEKNHLEFQIMHLNASRYFKCSILHLNVDLYHHDLNSKLLNVNIFQNTLVLDLNGVINLIQEDVFKSFKKLKIIRLRTQKVKKVFVENNKWLEYLNYDVNSNNGNSDKILILIIFQTFPNYEFYNYNDEDFCYFKDFPHHRKVLPELLPNAKSRCSCTEVFLIQYSIIFSRLIEYYIGNIPYAHYSYMQYYSDELKNNFTKCHKNNYTELKEKCDFANKIKRCKIETSNNFENSKAYFYIYDWHKLADITRFIFTIYINLILSIFGLLINGLIVLVLSNTKIMKDKMYFYLKINAIFNSLHILCLLVELISKDFEYSDFVDNFKVRFQNAHSKEINYIRLIFVTLIGNSVRTCSNIAHLSFTFSRYITVTEKRTWILNKFKNMKTAVYLLITVGFSFALNLHLFFEFEIEHNKLNTMNKEINLKNFSLYYKQDLSDDYKEHFSRNEYLFLNILQYIRIFFSELFYLISSTVLDLYLYSYVKLKMKEKRKLNTNRAAINLVGNLLANNFVLAYSNKSKNLQSSQKRISQMILFNGLNYMFFRFPFILISFYGFIFRYDNIANKYKPDLVSYLICKRFRFCLALEEVFYSVYLISYLVHFLIFRSLDKNFEESFKIIKQKTKKKLKALFM